MDETPLPILKWTKVLNLEDAKTCLKHHPFEKRRQERPIFEMQRCIEKHYHIWFFGLESFPCIQMVFCIFGDYQTFLFWQSNESSSITEKPGNVSFISNILQIGQNNVHQCLVVWTGTSKNTLLSRWMKVEGHIYRSYIFMFFSQF